GRMTTMMPMPAFSSASLAVPSSCVGSFWMRVYAGIPWPPIFVISCARVSSAARRTASFCVITTAATLPSPLRFRASGALHVDTHEVLEQDASDAAPARTAHFNSERMVLLLLRLQLHARTDPGALSSKPA